MATYHSASALNTQIYANKVKADEVEKLKQEIERLKKSYYLENTKEIEEKVKKTQENVKNLVESNREYEFVKKRVMMEKAEWKKKFSELRNTYEKIMENYSKVIASKEQAISNLNFAKHKLEEYEKQMDLVNDHLGKEFRGKTKVKEDYSNASMKIIEKIGTLEYEGKLNHLKACEEFESRQKCLETIQKTHEKNIEIRLKQEKTNQSLSDLNHLLSQRNIMQSPSPQVSILSLISLFKQEEYKSISLSLQLNDLSNTILQKKKTCKELQSELELLSSFPLKSLKSPENSKKSIKDYHEEFELAGFYAKFYSLASNIIGKIRKIEENSFIQSKNTIVDWDDFGSMTQPSARIGKKRSMLLRDKKKTITKSKTIREFCPRPTIIDKRLPKQTNLQLSMLFKEYKYLSEDDLTFFLNNQIILLALKPSDVSDIMRNVTGIEDFVKLYKISHENLRAIVQKILGKIIDLLINAKDMIPSEGIHEVAAKVLIPQRERQNRGLKFCVESSKQVDGTSTESIRKNYSKSFKFYSDSSTPVSYGVNDTDKEIRDFGNRLRKIELSARKAGVSNRIIKNELIKFRGSLPSLR